MDLQDFTELMGPGYQDLHIYDPDPDAQNLIGKQILSGKFVVAKYFNMAIPYGELTEKLAVDMKAQMEIAVTSSSPMKSMINERHVSIVGLISWAAAKSPELGNAAIMVVEELLKERRNGSSRTGTNEEAQGRASAGATSAVSFDASGNREPSA